MVMSAVDEVSRVPGVRKRKRAEFTRAGRQNSESKQRIDASVSSSHEDAATAAAAAAAAAVADAPHSVEKILNGDILRQIAHSAKDAEPLWKMRCAMQFVREIDGTGSLNPSPLLHWESRSAKLLKDFSSAGGPVRDVEVEIVLISPIGTDIRQGECTMVVKGVRSDMTWEQFSARLFQMRCTLKEPLPWGARPGSMAMPVIAENFQVPVGSTVKRVCLKQPRSPLPMWEVVKEIRDNDGRPFRVGEPDQELTPEKTPPFLPPIVMANLDRWRAHPSAGKSLFPANLRLTPLVKVQFTTPEGWLPPKA